MVSGMSIEVIPEYENVHSFIRVIFSGILIDLRALHSVNAYIPIWVMVLGKLTAYNEAHPVNA